MDVDGVFERVYPPLVRYCTRLTRDSDAGQDVAQEAFVRMVERKVEGDIGAVRVWLFKVATHLIRDRYRVHSNRERLLARNPPSHSPPVTPLGAVERSEDVSRVRQALARLPQRDREMLLMKHEGFRYREIAEAVDVAPASVGTLLARAQDRFLKAWEDMRPDHD